GTYTGAQTVTILDSTTGATIYYTTNGSTPKTSSTQYTGAFAVNSTETVKAIAAATGYTTSTTGSAAYALIAATPTFSPAAGTYTSIQTVTISDSTAGARIYYTTDGSTPSTSSASYAGAISVSSSQTVKAIATAAGYSQSAVGSVTYTINLIASTPTFFPAPGAYTSAFPVTISDTTPGVNIYYTTNGTTPTASSALYTGAITVSSTETVEAIATESGYAQSGVGSAAYALPPQAASVTTMVVTSGGSLVTSVTSGSVVVLTATVTSGGIAVTSGTVNFCDATATLCTDIHLLGTAQLTSAGTAAIRLRPAIGSHSYNAVFAGTSSNVTSSSSPGSLTVTGRYPTETEPAGYGGGAGNYTLDILVGGISRNSVAPTGTVSILDTDNSNAVLGTGSLSSTGTTGFDNFSTFPIPGGYNAPDSVATSDFNGDGIPDLAVANSGPCTISILLGTGNGTFSPATYSPISAGGWPLFVGVGDFNGDGMPDLVVVDGFGSITVLLGNGDGTFRPANGSPVTVGSRPVTLAVGDFNRDGKTDLAVVINGNPGAVTVLLGNGDGTFAAAANGTIATGNGSDSIAVGDFNGDGNPDLAVVNGTDGTVTILTGNGDGTFTSGSSPITVGSSPSSIAVSDFDGNGKLDLAVANHSSANITILMGNGDGTFSPLVSGPFTLDPIFVVTGDFNQDGIPDLAVTTQNNSVNMLLGNGDGSFKAPFQVSVGNNPNFIAVGDFGGYGVPELAVTNGYDSTLSIFQINQMQMANATVSGVATPVGSGTHNVVFSYGGDTNYTGSTSAPIQLQALVDVVTTVSPISGPSGTSITITGLSFGSTQGSSNVTIGGITAAATAWSDTQIQAQIPNGTGPGPQAVAVSIGGVSGQGSTFTVSAAISGVYPSTGLPGAVVKLSGTNFGSSVAGSSSVTFNGLTALVTSWTQTAIQVIIPNGASTGPVVVTACNSSDTWWCGASNGIIFTLPSGPTVTGLSPVAGSTGTNVTVSGINFGTSGTITFNGVSGSPTSWGMDTIIVPVPPGAATGPVAVTVGGVTGNSDNFTVVNGIAGIVPVVGSVGTIVTISGTGFGTTQGSSNVTFNGVFATPTSWSDTSIVVTVPVGAMTGNVVVQVNGASAVGPLFTVKPFIESLSPAAGPVGTSVTISGSNFGSTQGTSSVVFGQVTTVPTQWTQNTIVAPVPVGAVTGSVVVSVAGQPSNTQPFTVGAATTGSITGTVTQSDGVTPIAGATITVLNGSVPVATTVTAISGTYTVANLNSATYGVQASSFGFGAANQTEVSVSLGQAAVANFKLSSQSSISYTYDELGRLVGVASSTLGAAGYSYDAVGNILSINRAATGQVSILDFSPKSGPAGTAVTISGTSFSGNAQQNTVKFGSAVATVVSATSSQITATVPAGAATGPITVSAPGGTATSNSSFTVMTSTGILTIASFSPEMANAGATIAIAGSGFDVVTNDRVKFNGTLAYPTSATAVAISAPVPANTGSGPITVATPGGSVTSTSDFYVVPISFTPSQVDFTGRTSVGGAPFTGTITTGGDIGIVLFNGTVGQGFNLQISNSSIASATISILNPDGSTLAQSAFGTGSALLNTPPAPTTGTYSILVVSSGSASPGSLTLNLSQFTLPSVTPGTAQTVTITSPGQEGILTFSGIEGQFASVQLTNFAFPGACCDTVNLTILKPDGTFLVSTGMYSAGTAGIVLFQNPIALPVTGSYTVVIAPQNGYTGSTDVTVWLFSEQTSTISPGSPATVTINTPGQKAEMTFSGTAGQLASMQLTNFAFPGACCDTVNTSILGPYGAVLAPTAMYSAGPSGIVLFQNPIALPATGTYTAVIAPQNGYTGSANVAVYLFNDQAGTITAGNPTPVTISIPGQQDRLTFTATQGQSVSVQLSNYTFAGVPWATVNVSILKPDGTTTLVTTGLFDWGGGNLFLNPYTLPTTGTYTLVISPQKGMTGSATVTLALQ
ncbi:MAG: FG-GAP-like repeat-containing protein, partial [Terracidiphilus sp.]